MEEHLHARPVTHAAALRPAPGVDATARRIRDLQQRFDNRGLQRLVEGIKSGASAPAPVDGATKTSSPVDGAVKSPGTGACTASTDAGGSAGAAATLGGTEAGATPLVSPRFAGDPALQACRQGDGCSARAAPGPR
jgi:hypothetical protein